MKRLLCALLRHDWRPLTGYVSCNFRRCDRCGATGWES